MMRKKITTPILVLLIFILLSLILYSPFFLEGKLPFPGDAIIGGYHPWRDVIWQGRTTGYPLKNITISDAATQFYPWRFLAMEYLKKGEFPLWNIYEFAGFPAFASLATGTFYPLNIIFFFLPFFLGWGVQVVLQPILAGVFTYLFLRNKKFSFLASIFGSLIFAFSSFLLLQSEFLATGHAALWLPLALLSIDKLKKKFSLWFFFILILSLSFSILAGFLQVTIYVFLIIFLYSLFTVRLRKALIRILIGMILPLFLLAFQLLPFLELWVQTSRSFGYQGGGEIITRFFIPLENLIMFFAPDFLGNPATLNYIGKMHYYEFNGYVGIVSLFLVLFAAFSVKRNQDKKEIWFWFFLTLFGLLVATQNVISEIPYRLEIPIWSSLVPARAIFITQFSLAILACFGVDSLKREIKSKKGLITIFTSLIILVVLCLFLWFICFFAPNYFPSLTTTASISVAKRNLILPSVYLFASSLLFTILIFKKKYFPFVLGLLFLFLSFDLIRQGRKFLPFIDFGLIYPETKTIEFLRKQEGPFRFIPTHQELFPTNTQIMYQLESVEGYDPLVLNRYSVLISAAERKGLDDKLDSHFERTVYTRKPSLDIYDFLNVRYVLALEELDEPKLKFLFQEGETKVYENQKALPRLFVVYDYEVVQDEVVMVNKLTRENFNFSEKVILEEEPDFLPSKNSKSNFTPEIISYEASEIKAKVALEEPGILVVSDIFYPGWQAFVDDQETKIYRANYAFRAVFLPEGEHEVKFLFRPQSFKIGAGISVLTLFILIGYGIIRSRYPSSKRSA